MMVGAFRAVALTSGIWNGCVRSPWAMRPLPPAVLVHVGHGLEAKIAGPVGIAVPSFVGERIEVEVVLASTAKEASDLIRTGHLSAVSVVIGACPPHLMAHWRDIHREFLLAVDLVPTGACRNALIERVTYAPGMSDGQRRTQAAFDAHLLNLGPCQLDLSWRFDEVGLEAFDVLAPIVEPLRAERQLIAC